MPKAPTVHYNPLTTTGFTRCGRKLATVEHRTDPADATCNTCQHLYALDKAKGVAA